jgi:siroheme synthase (precorrin-2 oxidase/ferrochelatase)
MSFGAEIAKIRCMPLAPPYPLFLDLVQRPVLVVGGGAVGLRKARSLVESAARVTVVSPQFNPGFDELKDLERITGPYAATHMARKMWRLAFAATNIREVNAHVQKHAQAAGILCCRCDDPDEGDFSGGATQRLAANRKGDGRGIQAVGNLGGVTLVVSTTGASPMLSARICRQASAAIDPVLPQLANLLNVWRAQAKLQVPDPGVRRILLQRLAGAEMEQILRGRGEAGAVAQYELWLSAARSGTLGLEAGLNDEGDEGEPSGEARGGPRGGNVVEPNPSRAPEHAQ